MAKRNSTKTATKEALQSSEPKIQTFKGWQGMNIETSQREWTPLETIPKTAKASYNSHTSNLVFKQTDEKSNYALIQNNLRCMADGSLETRNRTLSSLYNYLCNLPTAKTFGVIDDNTRSGSVSTTKPISYSFDKFKFTNIIYMLENVIYAKLDCIVNVYAKNASAVTLGTTTPDGVIKQGNVLAKISISSLNENKNNWELIKLDSKVNAGVATSSLPYICDYANIITCVYSCLNTVLVTSTLQKTAVYTTATSSLLKTGLFQDMDATLEKRIGQGILYSDESSDFLSVTQVDSAHYIPEPTETLTVKNGNKDNPVIADDSTESEGWGTFWYTISSKFGSTLFNRIDGKPKGTSVQFKVRPSLFTGSKFLKLSVKFTVARLTELINYGATDLEFWYSEKGSNDSMVIGRVNLPKTAPTSDKTYTFSFYGSLYDTSKLATMSLSQPDYNTTQGPEVTRIKYIDSRLYLYGSVNRPYRLYMGGTSGMELCVSRGKGGGFIDCEPGSGSYITSVHKFKTQSGASIVTFLTGNKNTGRQKRYNLIETQITITSEIAENSWKYEEVTNVIGTNSFNGALVCADGLYMLSRYGLYVTTQAMEYNSQLRSQKVSSVISPIFENRLSPVFDNAVMIFIDEIIYFVFGCEDDNEYLDHIIFCYDVNTHAFYTYSYGEQSTDILTILPVDYIGWTEGIGIVTPEHIDLIPTVGDIRENTGNTLSYDYNGATYETACAEKQYNTRFKIDYPAIYKIQTDTTYYNPSVSYDFKYSSSLNRWFIVTQPMTYQRQGYNLNNHSSNSADYNESINHKIIDYSYHINPDNEVVCLNLTRLNLINVNARKCYYEIALFINARTLLNIVSELDCHELMINININNFFKIDAALSEGKYQKETLKYDHGSISGVKHTATLKFVNCEGNQDGKGHAIERAKNHVETAEEIYNKQYATVYVDNPLYPTDSSEWSQKSELQAEGFIEYEKYYMGDLYKTAWTNTKGIEHTGHVYTDYDGNIPVTTVPALTSGLFEYYETCLTGGFLTINISYNSYLTYTCEKIPSFIYELHLPNNTKYHKFKINKIDIDESPFTSVNNFLYFNKNISKMISCNYTLSNSSYYQPYPLFEENEKGIPYPTENLYFEGIYNYSSLRLTILRLGTPNIENQNIFESIGGTYSLNDSNPECVINYEQFAQTGSTIVTISQQVPLLWQTGELSTATPAQGFMNLSQLEFHFDYLQTDIDGLKITVNAVDYYGREIEVTRTFTQTTQLRNYIAPLRIDAYVESYNIRMEGTASLRMTHIIARVYVQGKKARQVYGHEALMHWITPNGDTDTNVQIDSYNDLYRAILP